MSLPPCNPQHSWKSSSCPDSWTSSARAQSPGRGGQGGAAHADVGGPPFSVSCVSPRRCSGTPCRSWHTQCRGPGGRCWASAGSGPPTETPARCPGRPCHQVLLCLSASTGASAAQEWGGPGAHSPEEHLPRSVRARMAPGEAAPTTPPDPFQTPLHWSPRGAG